MKEIVTELFQCIVTRESTSHAASPTRNLPFVVEVIEAMRRKWLAIGLDRIANLH